MKTCTKPPETVCPKESGTVSNCDECWLYADEVAELFIGYEDKDVLFRIGKSIELNGIPLYCYAETETHWVFSKEPGSQKMVASITKKHITEMIESHMCMTCMEPCMERKGDEMVCTKCGSTAPDDSPKYIEVDEHVDAK